MSRLEEKQSLLGGRMSDVLGGGGSTSPVPRCRSAARVRRRLERGADRAARLDRIRRRQVPTAAYGFDFGKTGLFGARDRLGLRLSQPLRVEHGGFAMLLPTAYDYATGLATNSLSHHVARPSGRELDGEISYGSALLGGNAWLGGNLFYRRQPGHIADAAPDTGAAVRFTLGF